MPSAKKRRDKNYQRKIGLKEKVTEALELPKEIVLDVPKMTILGNQNITIENYKGIIEYDSVRIRINTSIGIIKFTGNSLSIKEITSEDIMIDGEIDSIELLK